MVVFFDGVAQHNYYEVPNPTLGAPGHAYFVMPLEDGAHVSSAADAARATGMSPATLRAYTGHEVITNKNAPDFGFADPNVMVLPQYRDIYGLVFKVDPANMPRLPTALDANGWPHYLPGGHTAVNTGNGAYLLNTTREFVIGGGDTLKSGDFGFKIDSDGTWEVVRTY